MLLLFVISVKYFDNFFSVNVVTFVRVPDSCGNAINVLVAYLGVRKFL